MFAERRRAGRIYRVSLRFYRYFVSLRHRAEALARLTLAGVVLAAAATCAPSRQPARPVAVEGTRTGAALARVLVHNETSVQLEIAFRPAAGPGGEIGVGRVGAGEEVTLAPVPAGEPIVLVARTADRRRLELAPRTFGIDAEWVWRIPANAEFREGSREPGS
jgi:hypothetical protein